MKGVWVRRWLAARTAPAPLSEGGTEHGFMKGKLHAVFGVHERKAGLPSPEIYGAFSLSDTGVTGNVPTAIPPRVAAGSWNSRGLQGTPPPSVSFRLSVGWDAGAAGPRPASLAGMSVAGEFLGSAGEGQGSGARGVCV